MWPRGPNTPHGYHAYPQQGYHPHPQQGFHPQYGQMPRPQFYGGPPRPQMYNPGYGHPGFNGPPNYPMYPPHHMPRGAPYAYNNAPPLPMAPGCTFATSLCCFIFIL